jgi:hypothetical protein
VHFELINGCFSEQLTLLPDGINTFFREVKSRLFLRKGDFCHHFAIEGLFQHANGFNQQEDADRDQAK